MPDVTTMPALSVIEASIAEYRVVAGGNRNSKARAIDFHESSRKDSILSRIDGGRGAVSTKTPSSSKSETPVASPESRTNIDESTRRKSDAPAVEHVDAVLLHR